MTTGPDPTQDDVLDLIAAIRHAYPRTGVPQDMVQKAVARIYEQEIAHGGEDRG
jgi:hypothetical protein